MAIDLGGTLKEKYAGVPVWVWALLGTGALALVMIRKKSSGTGATKKAANQTATNLGSASQLQNLFAEAFPMNYSGGDIYINYPGPPSPVHRRKHKPKPHPVPTPNPSPEPIPTPPPSGPIADLNPLEYRVQRGDTLTSIAEKFGMTVTDLWNFNTGTGYGSAGRPASTIQILQQRGPGLLYANEEIDIPHKGTIYAGNGGA